MDKKKGRMQYKRRNYIVDMKFQSDFIVKFCALIVIGSIGTITILYLTTWQSSTVSLVNGRVIVQKTADHILPLLVQTMAIVSVFVGLATAVIAVFLSHRIAGPVYRFKKVVEGMGSGNFSEECRIRKHDQFQYLAEAFNGMINQTRVRLKALAGGIDASRKKLDNISERDVAESKRSDLAESKRVMSELESILRAFKV